MSVGRDEATLTVAPAGEIDLATVDLVRDAVERELAPGDALVLDLRRVAFMDTSGLRYVLELNERASRQQLDLRIVRGPRAVQRVFEVAGVAPALPFIDVPPEQSPGA